MVDTPASAGNTPTGNVGAGTRETSSAPDPVVTGGTARVTGANVPNEDSTGATPVGTVTDTELSADDFKKDGNLRKDAVRRISENAPPRSGERSYNEVTGETTVTTTVGGQTVTFVEEGDTRGPARETAMESLARASEDVEEDR